MTEIADVLPPTLRVQRVHLHPDNSSRRERHGHKYATLTFLRDRTTNEIVAEGHAYCSSRDNPSRRIGRVLSDGRALEAYLCA